VVFPVLAIARLAVVRPAIGPSSSPLSQLSEGGQLRHPQAAQLAQRLSVREAAACERATISGNSDGI
jgi:hypothetical protein